jgi:hypothetical protein
MHEKAHFSFIEQLDSWPAQDLDGSPWRLLSYTGVQHSTERAPPGPPSGKFLLVANSQPFPCRWGALGGGLDSATFNGVHNLGRIHLLA